MENNKLVNTKSLNKENNDPARPLISIIIPVYKVEKYLERCVDSILQQSFKNYEVILVDDKSPDHSPELCDEYSKKDNRIITIHHKKNKGVAAARNTGIDWVFNNSNSKWICFVDSDDWIHPLYLEILYRSVVESGLKLSITHFEKIQEYQRIDSIDQVNTYTKEAIEFYVSDSYTGGVVWNKLYHKSLFEEIRFPEGKIFEDEYISYKLLFKARKAIIIENILYFYFQREGSISSKFTKETFQHYDAICEEVSFLGKNGYKTEAAKLLDMKLNFFDYQFKYSMPKTIYFKWNGFLWRWRLIFTGFGIWNLKHFLLRCMEAIFPKTVSKIYARGKS